MKTHAASKTPIELIPLTGYATSLLKQDHNSLRIETSKNMNHGWNFFLVSLCLRVSILSLLCFTIFSPTEEDEGKEIQLCPLHKLSFLTISTTEKAISS